MIMRKKKIDSIFTILLTTLTVTCEWKPFKFRHWKAMDINHKAKRGELIKMIIDTNFINTWKKCCIASLDEQYEFVTKLKNNKIKNEYSEWLEEGRKDVLDNMGIPKVVSKSFVKYQDVLYKLRFDKVIIVFWHESGEVAKLKFFVIFYNGPNPEYILDILDEEKPIKAIKGAADTAIYINILLNLKQVKKSALQYDLIKFRLENHYPYCLIRVVEGKDGWIPGSLFILTEVTTDRCKCWVFPVVCNFLEDTLGF